MIELKNITKSFLQGDKRVPVLSDVSLKLESHGIVAIIGKSGSGKSTFLSLLSGLDAPTSGEILIDNKTITGLSEKELTNFRAKNIGIIFQNFHLVDNFTALENVLLPLEILGEDKPMERAKSILTLVGLEGRFDHFPSQLSGGEKQRVAIARAYVTNPHFILADEPSGNLDPETGESVMNILFKTARELKQTVILVTHDNDLAESCDECYEIKDHKIVKLS